MPEVQVCNGGSYEDLMREAYRLANFSLDPRTQNGAVLVDRENHVLARSFNDFPAGVRRTEERWNDRKMKLMCVDHAESSLIHTCARRGIASFGTTVVCPFAACDRCAVALINAGVYQVVVHRPLMLLTPDTWRESIEVAFQMFEESKVEIIYVNEKLDCPSIRFNGGVFHP